MTMQGKSDKKCHVSWPRVESYRVKTGKTWQEVAAKLDVGVSALMMVKSGKRGLSSKVIYRLTQAEIEAGIEQPVTGKTKIGELQEQLDRTGAPASALYASDYRARRIVQLEQSIKSSEETLGMIAEILQREKAELRELKRDAKK